MKAHRPYRLLLVVAIIATVVAAYLSIAAWYGGAMDMYAHNRELLDSATHEQRDSVGYQAYRLALRVGLPWVLVTVVWIVAFIVAARRGQPNNTPEDIRRSAPKSSA